jgi:hypothetical protein
MGHPQGPPAVCHLAEIQRRADPQLTHEIADGQPIAGAKQEQVAAGHLCGPGNALPGQIVKELGNR